MKVIILGEEFEVKYDYSNQEFLTKVGLKNGTVDVRTYVNNGLRFSGTEGFSNNLCQHCQKIQNHIIRDTKDRIED